MAKRPWSSARRISKAQPHPPTLSPHPPNPPSPLVGLRAVPKGKSPQWGDLRREGHESYARMARPRRIHRPQPSPLVGEGRLFVVQTKSRVRGSLRIRNTRGKIAAPSSAPSGHLLPRGEEEAGGWGRILPTPTPSSLPHPAHLSLGGRGRPAGAGEGALPQSLPIVIAGPVPAIHLPAHTEPWTTGASPVPTARPARP